MQIWYLDNDGDGFGTGATEALGCYPPTGYVDNNIDCDDSTSDRSPDNSELCDGIDNDCNLLIDDEAVNAPTWYQDEDGDGFGDPNSPIESCTIQTGLVSNDLDCDDSLATVYPSAPEIWYDNIDQNCDGIDDDQDQDGYPSAEDCDDTNKKIYPGSGHYDENCDLITTPGPSTEGATPKGGGGCATPIPFIPQLWWITVGLCLASRRRQPSA
jgi:hypothetical protein